MAKNSISINEVSDEKQSEANYGIVLLLSLCNMME